MNVIFIDIDGPLAWGTWQEGPVIINKGYANEFKIPYPWVQEDCDALNQIIQKTDAALVISSDWKLFFGLNQISSIFEHHGIPRWSILDATSNYNPKKKLSSGIEWDRACQIHHWVKQYKPKNWIAIDDLPLKPHFKYLEIPQWRHVESSGDFGDGKRLREMVDECIKKLNK